MLYPELSAVIGGERFLAEINSDSAFVMFGAGTGEQGVRTVMAEHWLEEPRRKRSP